MLSMTVLPCQGGRPVKSPGRCLTMGALEQGEGVTNQQVDDEDFENKKYTKRHGYLHP